MVAWSTRATEYLARCRRARRQIQVTLEEHGMYRGKALHQELKNEIHRLKRSSWIKFVADITHDKHGSSGKGLWRLSKWAKKSSIKQNGPPQSPALRRNENEFLTMDNTEKVTILKKKLLPGSTEADLLPDWRDELVAARSNTLAKGEIPSSLKEEITITIRKERMSYYTIPASYRPITLKNSLAKIIEKIVTNRMTITAEENMLSWVQMGARRDRSTISALEMLTSGV
ncbi:hypothetical protein Golomagni_01667 [Golovinomyces magnicellulatus]|nr:hypothetical protein Golomagni_01667 [Golovinomyces magnicellulatus]